MLIQHVLTEELITAVFPGTVNHKDNNVSNPRVTVEVKALFAILRKVFPKLRRRKVLEVVLSFDGEQFSVDFQGAQYGAKATGEWRGAARVSMAMFEAIIKLHHEDTLDFEYRAGKLRIGATSVSARWQDLPPRFIDLSIDTPEVDFLAICLSAPEAQVISSGLGPRFEAANDLLEKRIEQACVTLKFYGDFHDEVRQLVVAELKKRGRQSP